MKITCTEAWVDLMKALFPRLNSNPDDGFLFHNIPEIFIQTGQVLRDIIIDRTDFIYRNLKTMFIRRSYTLTFSEYKNGHTVKPLVRTCGNGMVSIIIEIYPLSIFELI